LAWVSMTIGALSVTLLLRGIAIGKRINYWHFDYSIGFGNPPHRDQSGRRTVQAWSTENPISSPERSCTQPPQQCTTKT
jgi:hypothetical protein